MNTTNLRIDLERGAFWDGTVVFEYNDENDHFISCTASLPIRASGSGVSYGEAYNGMLRDLESRLNGYVRRGEQITKKPEITFPSKPKGIEAFEWEVLSLFPDAVRGYDGVNPTWVVGDIVIILQRNDTWLYSDSKDRVGGGTTLRLAIDNYAGVCREASSTLLDQLREVQDAAKKALRVIGKSW
jgi:hypothetical protein